MMSCTGLWNFVVKPQVWHEAHRHLGFRGQEFSIFGQKVGNGQHWDYYQCFCNAW